MTRNFQNKNILILQPHPDNPGGVAQFYQELSSCYGGSRYRIHPIRIGRIEKYKIFKNVFIRLFHLLWDYIRFAVHLHRLKPVLIHINPSLDHKSIYREAVYIFITEMLTPSSKILVHFRGWRENIADQFGRKTILNFLIGYILRHADAAIVLSSKFKHALSSMPIDPSRIFVIPTAVNTKDFKPPSVCDKSREKTVTILFLSRIIRSKGVYELLLSIPLVLDQNHSMNLKFIIAGDGEERNRLIQSAKRIGIEDIVLFPGYVRDKEKKALFQQSDIFVFPSYQEGCPNAALEAMAAGLPIISTGAGCLEEIIENQVNGIVIRKKSIDDIVAALDTLIRNPDLRIQMGKNNNQKAAREFDITIIFNKIEKIYDKLLAGSA